MAATAVIRPQEWLTGTFVLASFRTMKVLRVRDVL
jgi:hypothetical protein